MLVLSLHTGIVHVLNFHYRISMKSIDILSIKEIYVLRYHTLPRNALLWTPMACAAASGKEEVVQLLIEAEAEINSVDEQKVNIWQL